MNLTEEQKKRIEESRNRALALRAVKSSPGPPAPASSVTGSTIRSNFNSGVNSFYKKGPSSSATSCKSASDFGGPAAKKSKLQDKDSSYSSPAKKFKSNSKPPFNETSPSGKFSAFSTRDGPVMVKCTVTPNQRFTAEARYFAPLIEVFKTINSRQYDTQTKNWSFDLKDYFTLVEEMKKLGDKVIIDEISDYVLSVFDAKRKPSQCDDKSKKTAAMSVSTPVNNSDINLNVIDEKLRETLLPFQRDAVCETVRRGGRILIADDMGLGKTLEALAVAAYYRSEWPLLIVSPASVLFMWRQQILDWLPSLKMDSVLAVQSTREERLNKSSKTHSVYIISYDMMAKCQPQLMDKNFKIIIMDESHLLKNSKTVRTKKAKPLLKKARRVILLTGTPALSRPSDLYTQLSVIDPNFFPSFHNFGLRYCNAKEQPWGWDYSGSSNLAELQSIMEKKLMIRRLKKDVLTQLPSKYRTMVVLNPSSVHIDKSMKTSHQHVGNVKGAERHGAMLEYFHETGAAKIKAIREYVMDLLEADKKFIVFAHHQNVLDAIEEAVESKYSFIRIDGRTSSESRNMSCDLFQSRDSVRLAILSIQAANSGLNLSAASLVVFAELFWNPGVLVQAEDRAHRIGQLDNVNVQYLVAKNTADDYIWPLIQQKLSVLSKAGLTKDNFSEANTHVLQDDTQRDITDFLSTEMSEEFNATSNPSQASDQTAGQAKTTESRKYTCTAQTLIEYFLQVDQKTDVSEAVTSSGAVLSAGAEDLWDDDCNDEDFTALLDDNH